MNIKDIAELSGVSIGTVSRIINNKKVGYSKETYEKVMKIVQDHNYTPNPSAQNLSLKESNLIGLIVPDVSNSFFAAISKIVENKAAEYGYTVLLGNTNDIMDKELSYIKTFINKRVDGIILISATNSLSSNYESSMNLIKESKIPVVCLDRIDKKNLFKSLVLDNKLGGYYATKHLLELGHRNIGCLTGFDYEFSSIERLEGYKLALQEYNIPFRQELILQGCYRIENTYTALPYFLKQKATAIFSFNDIMALGIMKYSEKYGLRIPEDISLIGFDNSPILEWLNVSLTTVNQPIEKMSEDAVFELISMINGNNTSTLPKIYTPELVIRNTTAPIKEEFEQMDA